MVFRLKQKIYIWSSPEGKTYRKRSRFDGGDENGNKSKIIVTRLPRDTIPPVRLKLRQKIIDNALVLPNRGWLFGSTWPRDDRTTLAKVGCESYDRSRRYPCPEITLKRLVESPTMQRHCEDVSRDTKPFPHLGRSIVTLGRYGDANRNYFQNCFIVFIASVIQ